MKEPAQRTTALMSAFNRQEERALKKSGSSGLAVLPEGISAVAHPGPVREALRQACRGDGRGSGFGGADRPSRVATGADRASNEFFLLLVPPPFLGVPCFLGVKLDPLDRLETIVIFEPI